MAGYGWFFLAILIGSEIALFKGIGLVRDFFYLFVWWPYIVVLDAVLKNRHGASPITSNPGCFLNLCTWSITFWLIFELINLRLKNWHYIDLTPITPVRWTGYALSFATVLPGIFLTSMALMDIFPLNTRNHGGTRKHHRKAPLGYRPFFFMGMACLILPILYPTYFFPLVWGFAFFLLDPLNRRLGKRSLTWDFLREGQGERALSLLLGGLICGFLWEFWNFWAGAKWIYTIPFVGKWKLFEMPVLGFLGFPPFALECYAMYVFVSALGLGGPEPFEPSWEAQRCKVVPLIIMSIPFWILSFWLIDTYTVWSFS